MQYRFFSSPLAFIRVHSRLRLDCADVYEMASNLNHFDRTIWQRLQKRASVGTSYDAIVEDHDDTTVTFRSNQAAYSPTEFQDRFGRGILRESITAACLHQLQFRSDEGMIGHR